MDVFVAGALALVAGVVVGIFGAGGSILLVPILVYVLHLPVKVSLGMALLILVISGMSAALAHARHMNVHWKVGLQWSAFGIGGAYLGGRLAEFIPEAVLLMMFASVVVVSAVGMLRHKPKLGVDNRHPKVPLWKTAAVGIGLGFVTGMIGVGGGFMLVPALVLLCGVDVKRAIGTSLVIIAMKSLGGFLGFAAHVDFPWLLTLVIAAVNTTGSLLGERLGKPLPAHALRPAFAVFLAVVGAAIVIQNILDLIR